MRLSRSAGIPRRQQNRWRCGSGRGVIASVALALGLYSAALFFFGLHLVPAHHNWASVEPGVGPPLPEPAADVAIPKIIHTSWITRPEDMPERMRSNFVRWAEVNPDFEVAYFDDAEQRDWMERNCSQYWPAWRAMQLPAGRADLFRYCVLYERGGAWVDVDITPLQPLSDHVTLTSRLVVTHDLGMGRPGFLYNAFMASRKGHPALKRAMDIVWEHYLRRYRRGAVHCTGPGVLWRAVNDTLRGGAEPHEFVGYRAETATQYVIFRGNEIWANTSNVPFLKAKYGGYLEDAKFEGREPHYGREVTWDEPKQF